jgi:peptide/nickel transport system substrate-binding protein
MSTRTVTLASLSLVATMLAAGCATVPKPQVVVQTQVVTQVQTQVVEQQVPVTTTPAPAKQAQSKDPDTFVIAEYGDIDNLDPALDYELLGQEVLQNVYETLVFYNKDKPNDFVPMLATKWDTSSDGKVYTFTVRSGVKFSDGTTLKPSDIAYSLQRGMLAGGTISPQWLMVQPLLGAEYVDIADLIDPSLEDAPDKLKAADPAKLLAACHAVTNAITADDTAGSVTFHLAQPWGPFIATLAQPWGAALSKNWAIANKLWDGNCSDWQNYYGPRTDTDPITGKAMGTGPYKLDHWTKGQEVGLTRNDNYWNTDSPLWPGAPTGPAKIQTVLIKYVSEWGTRYSMLQAGDADEAVVDPANYAQADSLVGEKCTYDGSSANLYNCQATGSGPLRVIVGLPGAQRKDAFFNFNINVPQQGGNQFVGSGKLDGKGIPPDFFADVNVRRAFNYCFDWGTYVSQALYGEAQQATSIFLPGEPGYDPNAPHYSFDLNKCADAFKASTLKSPDGKSLWDEGFQFEVGYNIGDPVREAIAQILSQDLNVANPKFLVEAVGLPWPAYLAAQRVGTLPLFVDLWQEDIHDPNDWIVPYATAAGAYASRQMLPKTFTDPWAQLANQAVAATDPAARAAIYKQFNQQFYDAAPDILGAVQTQRRYQQRWVQGYVYNPIFGRNYYYTMSKQ